MRAHLVLSGLAVALGLGAGCAQAPSGPYAGGGSGGGGAAGATGTAGGGGGAAGGSLGRAGGGGTGSAAGGSGGVAGAAGSSGAGAGGTAERGGTTGGGGAAGGAGRGGGAGRAGAGGGATPDGGAGSPGAPTVVEMVDVSDVFSGHPVFFSLVTRGDQQLAAFYDQSRQMTVAQRTLGSATWTLHRLNSTLGWDSHNYVTMAIDDDGFVHLAGNMHGVPLIYFRTTRALDAGSFQRVTSMVGSNEQACTYPQFFRGATGDLVFAYRDGASGSGNYIFNKYDVATTTWSRVLNTPLLDGEGDRSAYPVGPILGPDGWFHIVWVWRDTPDAATNHDLSYARSRDLVRWERAGGQAVTLPITIARGDIVDPVRAGGGMINNNTKIGFDAQHRPIVAYHKFDAAGNTQLYNARFEDGRWVPRQASSWGYRWAFGGNGTLVFEIEVEPAKRQPDGSLTQEWYHARHGGWGAFRLDETTLASTAMIEPPRPYPRALDQVQSTTAGMAVRWAEDGGAGPDPAVRYFLRWETLPSNRDMPRDPVPPPTRLRLYGVAR